MIFEYEENDPVMEESAQAEKPDLKQYLSEIYGDNRFYEIVRTHAQEKLPLTKDMKDYLYWDSKEKEAKEAKEFFRNTILKQHSIIDHPFDGIKFSKIKSRPLDDEKTYQWATGFLDGELLEEVTIKTIDYNKFEKLYLKGRIQYGLDDLPNDLRDTREYYRINVEKKK